MKKLWSLLVILFMLGLLLPAPASAEVISISQQIHITGVVPPMRFIVVDGQGNLIEVTSNTPENVTPVVRLNSVSHGATLPLTPLLLKQYYEKTKGHDMHSLDLYFAEPSPQVTRHTTPELLTALTHTSFLKLPFYL